MYLIGLVLACVGLLAQCAILWLQADALRRAGPCFAGGGQSDGSVIRRGRFMGPTHGAGLLSRVSSLEPVATGRLVRWPSSRLDVSSCSVDVPSLDLGTSSCSLGTPCLELRTSSRLLRMPGLEPRHDQPFARVSSAKPGVSSRLLGVRGSEPGFPGSMH